MKKKPAKAKTKVPKAKPKVPKAKPKAAKAKPKAAKTVRKVAAKPQSSQLVHPKLSMLLGALKPGRHAGGTLLVTAPDAYREQMSQWLMGNVEGRVALGRTAFGDILVFRDLRARAAAQGLDNAAEACDIVLIDLNFRKMTVLAWSVEELLGKLDDAAFQRAFLRKPLYDQVKALLGDYDDDQAYGFVPALALGGEEKPECVQRSNWLVYQEILFQL